MNLNLIGKMCDLVQAADGANSSEELDVLMTSYFRGVGVKMYSYRHRPPVGAIDYKSDHLISSYGFPASWTEFYVGGNYCSDDPMINIVIEKNQPCRWADLIQWCDKTAEVERYITQVKRLGIGFGLMLPVYGACSRSGVFTLGFEPPISDLSPPEISMLQSACQIGHLRYNDMVQPQPEMAVDLTPREREVIKLVSHGKSNGDIAHSLGISKHTIDGYLRRIYLKMDVSERVSASLRAMSLGLV